MVILYYQSIVQYRIDTESNGAPEIIKKFTSPIKGAKDFNKKKKPKTTTQLTSSNSGEVFIA